jgi:glycerol-1-phosphate dehydrogenase [NAD(P)+]
MDVAGSSRPASGSEHLISHAYDAIQFPNHSLHGLQVGVAALAVSAIQQRTHEAVRKCLTESGFVEFMATHPLNRESFIDAIRRAPSMKEDFCTVLSVPENREALLDFVNRDGLISRMLTPHTH